MSLLFGCLAVLGVILLIIGRYLIIADAKTFSSGWAWAIRLLPLADVMYLARFWDSAKGGAILSISGLILLLPVSGQVLWEKKHAAEQAETPPPVALTAELRAEIFPGVKAEHAARLARKEQKLHTLQARLTAWDDSMAARRTALEKATPAELQAFNEEAAAYAALRAIAKTEAEALLKLQGKKFVNAAALSEQECRDFLERDQPSRRRGGRPNSSEDPEDESEDEPGF